MITLLGVVVSAGCQSKRQKYRRHYIKNPEKYKDHKEALIKLGIGLMKGGIYDDKKDWYKAGDILSAPE